MNIKICPKCKKGLAADVETCPSCGTDMRSVAEIQAAPTKPTENQEQPQVSTNNSGGNNPTTPQRPKSTGEIFWGIMGIVCGITIFIVGLVNISLIDSVRFGADFYTEIHEVTAACATGIYGLYVVIGIALVLYYAHKICENK